MDEMKRQIVKKLIEKGEKETHLYIIEWVYSERDTICQGDQDLIRTIFDNDEEEDDQVKKITRFVEDKEVQVIKPFIKVLEETEIE